MRSTGLCWCPALIGLRRPAIVLLSWVLQLDADATKTILTHEREHRRAGDSRLIAAARLLCIAIPWNPVLWWMTNRLARAIEFDCDARVLRHGIGAAAYADVLLSAQRCGARSRRLVLLTGFAEWRSRLGARIDHLLRPAPQGVRVKSFVGGTVALALASLAVAAPIQQAARARSVRLIVVDGDSVRADLNTEQLQGEEYRARSGDRVIAIESWLDPANARRMYGDIGANGASLWFSQAYVDRLGPTLPSGMLLFRRGPVGKTCGVAIAPVANRIAMRLLTGIDVTPDQRTSITEIVVAYVRKLQSVAEMPEATAVATAIATTDSRDSAIRRVLTSEVQRTRFDKVVADERRFLVQVPLHEIAVRRVWEQLQNTEVSELERASATRIFERAITAEVALYERAPKDWWARESLEVERDNEIRSALLTDAARASFDRHRWIRFAANRAQREVACETQ
jgi:hypothetical protein